MYKPNYQITDELLGKIAEIESYRTKVDSSYILPEREIEMRYRATVEATHSSTSIEGNPLNMKQVEKVLSDSKHQQLTRHQYAETEVKNYKKALDFIDKRKDFKKPITLKDILVIHSLIMTDLLPPTKIGTLRQKAIYIADQDDNVKYTGPGTRTLTKEIDELLSWLTNAKDVHPVIAAAVLHFQFVSIHPFSDGNGRATRALTTLYLGLRDYGFRDALVLDSYYSSDKLAYYAALDLSDNYEGRKEANLNPWINYFTDGFLSSANLLSAEVAILSNLAGGPRPEKISRDDVDLLSYAQQFGSISLSEAEEILRGVHRRAIQRRLKKLVDGGYLEMVGSARDTRYKWNELPSATENIDGNEPADTRN
jgi:Fic family protein